MPRGSYLIERELGHIEILNERGENPQKIADFLDRSRNSVVNAIKMGDNYGKWDKGGRPRVTTALDDRQISRLLCYREFFSQRNPTFITN
jgi:hypothetical protein